MKHPLRLFFGTYQACVALAIFALTANYFHDNGHGYGLTVDILVIYGVLAAAALIPAFWALTHICGGVLFGIAAGGIGDGVKLGLILGLGLSIGKFWLYVAAAAVGTYVGHGPHIYIYGGAALAFALFIIDRTMTYFWRSTSEAHSHG